MAGADDNIPDDATSRAASWLSEHKLHHDSGGPLDTAEFWLLAGLLARDWKLRADNEPDRSELVEAAQTILADWKIPACPHGGEPWNCGSCEYEWGKRIAVAIERLRAALEKETRCKN